MNRDRWGHHFLPFLSITQSRKCGWGQISYVHWVCSTDVPRYSVRFGKQRMCVGVFLCLLFFLLKKKKECFFIEATSGNHLFLKYFNCSVMSDCVSHDDLLQFETLRWCIYGNIPCFGRGPNQPKQRKKEGFGVIASQCIIWPTHTSQQKPYFKKQLFL